MNERERADMLARAIDDLIKGLSKPEPEFEDEELRSLLHVARARLQEGTENGRHGADHEDSVWRHLIARLEGPGEVASVEPSIPSSDDQTRGAISARQQMSEEMRQAAEQHRDEVWRRLEERLARNRPPQHRGIFSFLQPRARDDAEAADMPPPRTRLIPTGDSDLDSLMQVALGHSALRHAGENELGGVQAEIRRRMRADPGRRTAHAIEPERVPSYSWAGALILASITAAVIALAAPIVVSGLADSPVAEAVSFLKERLGVQETEVPPPAPGPATMIGGDEMTAAEAGAHAGLSFTAPAALMGLSLASQRFFPAGIGWPGAGTFAAIYGGADGALTVYEEPPGGADLSVPAGSVADLVVGSETATYFEGSWSSEGGPMVWQPSGTQTLAFERDGIRFVLQYTGPWVEPSLLAAAGTDLAR